MAPYNILFQCYGFSKETSRMNGLLGMHELRGFWVNGRPNAMIVKADADVDGDTGG